MKRTSLIAGGLVLAFIGGLSLAWFLQGGDSEALSESAVESPVAERTDPFWLPVAAQEVWFPPLDVFDTDGGVLDDEKFDELLTLLGERLDAASSSGEFEREANIYLYGFVRRITQPQLSDDQVVRAEAEFERFSELYPDQQALLEKWGKGIAGNYAKASEFVLPFAFAESWFPPAEDYDTQGRPFADDTVDELLGILDALLAMPETVADFETEAGAHFFSFMRAVQFGILTEQQTARINDFLDRISERHPEADELLGNQRFFVNNLLPGNQAPNIVGKDINGDEFELLDYLGDVVVVYFSGEWCGPCRTEYPFKRLMLDIFEDQPVTILGVNSDEDIETVRETKKTEELDYRVWWDGHGDVATEGPIARAWKVVGWPTIYVLDEDGIIRYTQKRHAGVITAVSELLVEKREGRAIEPGQAVQTAQAAG